MQKKKNKPFVSVRCYLQISRRVLYPKLLNKKIKLNKKKCIYIPFLEISCQLNRIRDFATDNYETLPKNKAIIVM